MEMRVAILTSLMKSSSGSPNYIIRLSACQRVWAPRWGCGR